MAADEVRDLVVRQPRKVRRASTGADLLDRRQAQRQDLLVIAGFVHRTEARIHVPHRRKIRSALQAIEKIPRRTGRYGSESFQAGAWQNVRKGVNGHASSKPGSRQIEIIAADAVDGPAQVRLCDRAWQLS